MAPKKGSVKTVVTATKVVEETVKLVVTPQGKETEKVVQVISSSTKEDKNIEFITTDVKKSIKSGRKRKKRRGVTGGEGYKRYVFKVMKQVHPDMGISSKAMTIINNYMTDMFERLANEAAKLQTYSGKKTMSSWEVQGAVKLVLPGELGKHAIAQGTKAVTNYVNYVTRNKVRS